MNLERSRNDFRNSIVRDDDLANRSRSVFVEKCLAINHDVRRFGLSQNFHYLGARHPHFDGGPTLKGSPGKCRSGLGPGSGKDRTLLRSHRTFQSGEAPILICHHTL